MEEFHLSEESVKELVERRIYQTLKDTGKNNIVQLLNDAEDGKYTGKTIKLKGEIVDKITTGLIRCFLINRGVNVKQA